LRTSYMQSIEAYSRCLKIAARYLVHPIKG
jgi:hypothetical protein